MSSLYKEGALLMTFNACSQASIHSFLHLRKIPMLVNVTANDLHPGDKNIQEPQ